jgi:hypothetical protein
MSYLSLFEMRARYSIAISILNDVRHWLLGRSESDISKEIEILKEALDLEDKEKSTEWIMYRLQGYTDKKKAATAQISEVFQSALERFPHETDQRKQVMDSLRSTLNSKSISDIDKDDKERTLDLITTSIDIIGSAESVNPASKLIPKIL